MFWRTELGARSRPPPDSEMTALTSDFACGNVLMMKTFVAPADWPNKTTFFWRAYINIIMVLH
jgi:hypothetical protein